jgi:hypothetical protein
MHTYRDRTVLPYTTAVVGVFNKQDYGGFKKDNAFSTTLGKYIPD